MRVLNISSHDYANMSHQNANALRSVGVDCRDAKIFRHNFKYKTESQVVSYKQILDVCRYYDVIQVFHTDKTLFNLVKNSGKKIVVYHTGTRYRQNKEMYNQLFKNCSIITDQVEFVFGSNMKYIAPHVDSYSFKRLNNKKIVIGHFPSNDNNKGTLAIINALKDYRTFFDVRIDSKIVPHEKNLERMAMCDYYVEMMSTTQNGKDYGCHGVTAFEASAVGCKVITNSINRKVYEDAYGDYPFLIANSVSELISIFEHVKAGGEYELPSVFKNHNIKSTGNRIIELIK